jgi:hypothetical protein
MPTHATPAATPRRPQTAARAKRRVPMDARRRDLAQIHQLAKELQLQDDAYRDLMATVCGGVRSAGDLDVSGRQRFIAHLKACQGRSHRPTQHEVKGQLSPQQKLMWALWMQLADAGLVQQRTMAAISSYAARQTGVARVEWLNGAQELLVIESLKQWLKRGRDGTKG